MSKERNTVKIDAKITPTLHDKIVRQAAKEKRNKSQMVRVILEERFEDGDFKKIWNESVPPIPPKDTAIFNQVTGEGEK